LCAGGDGKARAAGTSDIAADAYVETRAMWTRGETTMPAGWMMSTDDERRKGQPCACFACGVAVFPLPLRTNPAVQAPRAYAHSVTVRNKQTGELESYAILFCPVCADPEDVQDYAQFEPALTHDAAMHATRIAAVEDTCHPAHV